MQGPDNCCVVFIFPDLVGESREKTIIAISQAGNQRVVQWFSLDMNPLIPACFCFLRL